MSVEVAKGEGFAWAVKTETGDWILGDVVEATKDELLKREKPDKEALAVPVTISLRPGVMRMLVAYDKLHATFSGGVVVGDEEQ
jgi:shikimate kinase